MIIVSRIIHVKVDRRLSVTNKFKYQRRLSSRLAIVMFRGTPCMFIFIRIELYDVKIVYDVTKLTKAHNELLDALSCYEYGVKYKDKHDRGLSMYPHCCSR